MTLYRSLVLVVLLLSVGGNVVLARAVRRGPLPEAPAAVAAATAPEPSRSTFTSRCGGLTALEQEVAQKSEKLRAVLPPRRLFEAGQPNPAAERLMQPILKAALASLTRGSHRLACRDVACQLVISHPAAAGEEAWDQALAGHADFLAWSQDFGADPARRIEDPAGQPLLERTIYFKLNGPRALASGRGQAP
jgi:hypothetical protein